MLINEDLLHWSTTKLEVTFTLHWSTTKLEVTLYKIKNKPTKYKINDYKCQTSDVIYKFIVSTTINQNKLCQGVAEGKLER